MTNSQPMVVGASVVVVTVSDSEHWETGQKPK